MSNRWQAAALAVLLCTAVSCGGDKSTAPEPQQLTGLWNATSVQYVFSPSTSVDLIQERSYTASLLLNEDHTYRYVLAPPSGPADTLANSWDLSSDGTMTLRLSNGEMQFDTQLADDTLRLTGADSPFDYNGDGLWEEGKLNRTFARAATP